MRRRRPRARAEAQRAAATSARSPPPTSSAPPSRARAPRPARWPIAGAEAARVAVGQPLDDASRRARGGSARAWRPAGRPRSASAVSTTSSSTAASSRSSASGAQHVGLGRRVQRAQRRQQLAAHAVAGELGRVVEASSRHASPRAAQCAAVSSRVTPSSGRTSRPSRAAIPSSARRPGEAGEPVEDGLDLVGRGVAGGDVAPRGASAPGGVAHVARPRLEVAARRRRRADDLELDAEPLAQRRAVRLVAAAPAAQAVVDVQRGHGPRSAIRTATSSRQTESRPPESSTTTGPAGPRAAPPARTRSIRSPASARRAKEKRRDFLRKTPPPRGQCGPLPRPAAFVMFATPCGDYRPHFPACCRVEWHKVYSRSRCLSTAGGGIRPRRCGYSSSSIAR